MIDVCAWIDEDDCRDESGYDEGDVVDVELAASSSEVRAHHGKERKHRQCPQAFAADEA